MTDIADRRSVEAAVAAVGERFRRIDIVVNNAGIGASGTVADNDDEEWARVLDINVTGIARVSTATLPWLRQSPAAAIVNTSSIAAQSGLPLRALYSASKGAVLALTRAMATDHVREGIRVNCVAPGAVEVERTKLESPDYGRQWGSITPLGRVGTPADVGQAVVFLASDQGAFVNGQTVGVDGGLFIQTRWAYDE